MPEHVYRKAKTCDICALDFDHGWWCRNCGTRFCDVCSKGGRSSSMGVAARIIAGYVTYGISEIVRAGYRKANQKCPNCNETDLMRINDLKTLLLKSYEKIRRRKNMSIFMSYISEEVSISKVLKKWIETAFEGKHKVFVSSEATDLPPGSRWLEYIESAIGSTKIIIVLCSPESIKHPWISFEAGAGWIQKKEVIPICHSGLKINNLLMPLSNFQALDMEEEDFPGKLFYALSAYLGKVELSLISLSDMKSELSNALVSIKPKQFGTIEFESSSRKRKDGN